MLGKIEGIIEAFDLIKKGMISVLLKLKIQQRTKVKNRQNYYLGQNILITSTKKVGDLSS